MNYFTDQEIETVTTALETMSKAGLVIDSHSGDAQRKTFFDKAKLWHAIDLVIAATYIDQLKAGKLSLYDSAGKEYQVSRKEG